MNIPDDLHIEPDQPGVLKTLPRRAPLDIPENVIPLEKMRIQEYEYSWFTAVSRLFTWISILTSYYLSSIWGFLRGKRSIEAQAKRFRRAFENHGGVIIKLGIHLSMRVDLLPWAFTVELSKMSDVMAPFPVENAIESVENAIKMPLSAAFSRFDPEPIESTSTACIYQALFHNKERVIVKVRRPGVGSEFMADLQAFEWLLQAAEFLTIFKPGFTERIYNDFRNYLLEELDFEQEARRQDAFRRSAKAISKNFFSAPKVYLGLSNDEVVVEEFISGLWLKELIQCTDNPDEKIIARAQKMNISSVKVSKRLMWAHYWSIHENLFFLANPQPEDIIIGKDSKIYFTNFSNTGSLNRSNRQALQQMHHYIDRQDPQNIARASIVLLEPLPPLDLVEITSELELFNWQFIYNLEASPESLSWEERTSVILWHGLIELAKKYGIIIQNQVLLLMRATLVTESTAIRLNHNLDIPKVYRKVEAFRADQARNRMVDNIVKQLEGDVNERLIIRMDRIAYSVQSLFFRTRHSLSLPFVNFSALMGKWSFGIYTFFRFTFQILLLTGAFILITAGFNITTLMQTQEAGILLRTVVTNPLYQVLFLVLLFANGRSVLFRLDDIDVN